MRSDKKVEIKFLDIAETCRRLGVQPADIEAMEEEGLITLAAAQDGKALPSDQLDRLEMIVRLQHDLGVNLPGIDVILEMRDREIRMRREVDEILEFLRHRISEDLRELLGEEKYPLALGAGEDFLSIGEGNPGREDTETRGRGAQDKE
jgi:MerR family transcriptional regulator/heat shock protein HspR